MAKIILYTNRGCPWAHRAHIALKELGLDYEEITIDLNKPREPWYLEVNPRGLVPSLSYNGNIILESAIVAQFLADSHPSHLIPATGNPENSLVRARIAFFVDTFVSKIVPHFHTAVRTESEEARQEASEALAAVIAKDIEPLLPESGFFGGSERLTLAEVLTGSFLLRILAFSKPEHGLLSPALPGLLAQSPKFSRWSSAVVAHESVNFIWDEKAVAYRTKVKRAALNKK
ncbi:hypothetical protein ASPZODRAFT_11653 [Penicilliopsis zonata CBS 506.65]|uniref:GST N-terminal domain-containing protein n=1 Tax=Penicilliopsis zonata CBS 506.65 TaxID=1073090 RepID=A0A1L9SUS7_9EURO|nr:hypothetical protein ASPZODRAFT_11653 [Penicilliopsis zonata CBS 506.65]OJJ50803.1 hypothetical protein ASPZODRAFT_11653 [Penicilliopsis zonata CBS 506.65]